MAGWDGRAHRELDQTDPLQVGHPGEGTSGRGPLLGELLVDRDLLVGWAQGPRVRLGTRLGMRPWGLKRLNALPSGRSGSPRHVSANARPLGEVTDERRCRSTAGTIFRVRVRDLSR